MLAHRVEATLEQDGSVVLKDLPFHAGERVEVIVLAQQLFMGDQQKYPLCGTPFRYDHPTTPVALDDWDAAE
jgi:hypothetical protein